MSDNLATGKVYRVLVDVAQDIWDKVSFWTSADDVEFIGLGKTLTDVMDEKAPKENPSFSGYISLENTSVNGSGSISLGDGCEASGDNSMSQGNDCISSGDSSFAGGIESEVSGDGSIGYGLGIDNSYDNAAVFGKYNDTTNISNVIFMIGNGSADNSRSNAVVLYGDGDVVFSGDVTDGVGNVLSDKIELSDLENEVDYSVSIPLMNVIEVGKINVGTQAYSVYVPIPDFNVQNPSNPGYIANKPTIPTTASDLTVTGGGNLQSCLDDMQQEISEIPKMKKSVVNSLPTTNIDTDTLYLLVSSSQTSQGNLYDEYINLDGTTSGWELIGSQSGSIDLHDYYTKTETEQKIQDAIDDIFSTGQAGQFLVSDGNGGYNWVTIPTAENNNF